MIRKGFGLFALIFLIGACAENEEILDLQEKEENALDTYIADNKIGVSPTSSGLYFLDSIAGNALKLEDGDSVYFNYTGMFLSGEIFAKSEIPLGVVVGENKVIQGIEEAFTMMYDGELARLIIPSSLAYGEMQVGQISPFTPLIYDIEIALTTNDSIKTADNQLLTTVNSLSAENIEELNYMHYMYKTVVTEDITPTETSNIIIDYRGYTMEDSLFVEFENLELSLSESGLLLGVQNTIYNMKKGEEAVTYFSSRYGYGRNEYISNATEDTIKAFSPLRFEIKLTDVVNN